ncbi:O-antigen ligase family protein [Amycolatopsis minnesotensis]|uniref:O-antigen ligase-related domain-containing protein n=1 Tax=Amycolatopsis minnesotensis TaxID=337894 RepID=A0ABN2Q6K8_9PSEU
MTSLTAVRARVSADGTTLVCLYVLVLMLVPAKFVISRIPMTMAPITVLAFGLGVVWGCAHLVSTLRMAKGRTMVRTGLFLMLATHLLTYGIATRRYLPPDEVNLTDSGLIRILGTISVALFVCDAVVTRDRLDRLLKVVVGVVAVMAGVGILQFAFGFDLTQYLNVPGLRAQGGYDAIQERAAFRRPAGTTNHPIEYGLICAAVTPLAGHYAFNAKGSGVSAARWWLCTALIGGGALVSVSRTAILGLLIVGVVLVLALPGRRKIVVLGCGLGAIGVASLLVPGLIGTLYGLFANIDEDPSVTSRTDDYTVAWQQVDLHPWTGRGFGTYLPDKYQLLDNQYLLTLIENGWIGLLGMLAAFVLAITAAVKVRMSARDLTTKSLSASLIAGVAVGVAGAATFDLFSFGVATGLVFVLIGASGALNRIAAAERKSVVRMD